MQFFIVENQAQPKHTDTTLTMTHDHKGRRTASGCTYRYKLPVPFGGRLVSKRQGGLGRLWEDTRRETSRQVRG